MKETERKNVILFLLLHLLCHRCQRPVGAIIRELHETAAATRASGYVGIGFHVSGGCGRGGQERKDRKGRQIRQISSTGLSSMAYLFFFCTASNNSQCAIVKKIFDTKLISSRFLLLPFNKSTWGQEVEYQDREAIGNERKLLSLGSVIFRDEEEDVEFKFVLYYTSCPVATLSSHLSPILSPCKIR